ncbi:MAG: hypothetical protein LBQ84_07010 [Flavobacteriaceae bacterium]|jgi:hypothetical protein|nr:hypothetical protein [Flavobacteriaceae bacterium]
MRKIFICFILILPSFFIAQNKDPQYYFPDEEHSYVYKILEKVRTHEKVNHPDNLDSYQYYVYNKFYIDDFNYGFLSGRDSVTVPDVEKKELIFLGERLTKCKYDKRYGKKNIIIADQVSGFKEPFYELFKDPVFQEEFPGILKKEFYSYNFRLIDSVTINQEKRYVISFGSRKNLLLNGSRGVLYIDAQSFAVVRYSGEEYRGGYTRFFEYTWKPFQKVWYPEDKINKIRINTVDMTKFFGKKYQKQPFILTPWIVIQSNIRDFSQPDSFSRKEFKGYMHELEDDFRINSESKIIPFRQDSLNDREKQAYRSSSLFESFSVEKNVKMVSSLKKGKLSVGKFDLNLLNLTGFNDYEGFRFQLGGKTNYKFSRNYSLNGYAAFGTKDTGLKSSLGIDIFVAKKYDGKMGLKVFSDVNPFSREMIIAPETFEQVKEDLNYIQNAIFYSYKGGEISYKQDFFRKFTTSFILGFETQKSRYDYSYKNNESGHEFSRVTTSLQIKYAPFAEYMQTPEGKLTVEDKPVYFYLNYIKGWKEAGADFDYHKFDISSDISIKNPLGTSNFVLNSGYVFGRTALWNLYGSFGNAKEGSSIFKRFSTKGFHSFETLLPGDFFADKYIALFFTHTFDELKLWGTKKLYISLIYNGMIGNMEHRDIHSRHNFLIPEKYYQEVGVEFNRLISRLGLGVYYRIGAYNQDNFDDNMFVKLTYDLF